MKALFVLDSVNLSNSRVVIFHHRNCYNSTQSALHIARVESEYR